MRSTVTLACFAVLLVGIQCSAPVHLRSSVSNGEEHWRLEVEERFAVKYCYRQYKDQADINYCLLRAAHLPRRNS
jgi:ubiquitin C-terminal hydrolase